MSYFIIRPHDTGIRGDFYRGDDGKVYQVGDARPRRESDPLDFFENGTLTEFGLWNRGLDGPPPPQRPRGSWPHKTDDGSK